VVVRDGDAEDAIAAQARGEPLEEALAIDRLLLRPRKPCRRARHVREERVGAKADGDGRRGELQAPELFTRDGKDEIRLALGRGEVERHARARLPAVLERKSNRCAPAPRPRATPSNSASSRRKGKSSASTPSASAGSSSRERKRGGGEYGSRGIGVRAYQATQREHDLGTEAARDSLRGQREDVLHAKDAEVGEARERAFRPVEEEERKVVEAAAKLSGIEACAHLQSPALRRAR
jgi:hypothetical protein